MKKEDIEELVIPEAVKEEARVKRGEVKESEAEKAFEGLWDENVGMSVLVGRVLSHRDVGGRWYPDMLEEALGKLKIFGEGK